jgi:hypothetical protein
VTDGSVAGDGTGLLAGDRERRSEVTGPWGETVRVFAGRGRGPPGSPPVPACLGTGDPERCLEGWAVPAGCCWQVLSSSGVARGWSWVLGENKTPGRACWGGGTDRRAGTFVKTCVHDEFEVRSLSFWGWQMGVRGKGFSGLG